METGHTFTENSLGTTTIFTIDPQNIQTYYSTNCKDYGVHRLRKRAFYPLLGDSVLSTDRIGNTSGLDSTYVYKIQRGNFPSFEIRFQEFLKHILRNGTTVNLSPLLDDLFLDTSTEFIFGESVSVLDESSDEASGSHRFLNSFYHTQRGISIRSQLRTLSFLYQDRWD
ncbi:hypothetical protein BofuT4_P107210.1 [Botrytis cinerea T4]|uniref:Uncharacterized protein n=1 Tax=Botryotinia fuckeliana (strain T4) TaxID=999810 RepID=G2Y6T5_BOTF4|nr:hypothetical protein BofuT4_P107210.1 [Botrytis cinerea T4]